MEGTNNALGLTLPLPYIHSKKDREQCFSLLGYGLPEGVACRQPPRHNVRIISAPETGGLKMETRTLSLSAVILSPASDRSTPSIGYSSPSSSSSSSDPLDAQFDFPFPITFIEGDRDDDKESVERSSWSPSTTCDSPTLEEFGAIFAEDSISEQHPSPSGSELSRHPALSALSPKSMALSLFGTLSPSELKQTAVDFGWLQTEDEISQIHSLNLEQTCNIAPVTSSPVPASAMSSANESPVSAPSMHFTDSDASSNASSSATSLDASPEPKQTSSIMNRGRPLPKSFSTTSFGSAGRDAELMIKRRATTPACWP